jgi:hypothetical protein
VKPSEPSKEMEREEREEREKERVSQEVVLMWTQRVFDSLGNVGRMLS